MEDDDLALLDRWCGGDQRSGNALFKRHYTAVYRFLENKTESEDAADLVQETFLACQTARERFHRSSSFRTFLYSIARHMLYRYWHKRSGRGDVVDFDEVSIASLSTTAGTRIDRRGDRARILVAMRQLPVEQRLLLELHYWQELDNEQIAEIFEIEPATVRSRLFRARAALRESLSDAATARLFPIGSDEDLDAWARSLAPEAPLEVRND